MEPTWHDGLSRTALVELVEALLLAMDKSVPRLDAIAHHLSLMSQQGEEHEVLGGISDQIADIGDELYAASDREKLERDSPLKNAQKINIPVLLVHGTKDWQVQMDHTIEMSDKLDEFEKPNTTVIIKGANHDFERKSERIALLKAVEDFLAQNLTASASP